MTTEVSRRDLVRVATALAVGAGMTTAGSAFGQQASKPAADTKPADPFLAEAKRHPEGFVLSDPEIFALDIDGWSRELIITSARNEDGNQNKVYVPSHAVRIFRADASIDEFTREGGLYWSFRDKPGKVKLKSAVGWEKPVGAGEVVMVVRDEDTVRCYTMHPDFRC